MSALSLRLRDDQRGVILIVGAVMGALLVGALWYIASIGDAIIYRERMQDAADATAFEEAVWHARGMNAIALLNIVMAAALSVLVALRVFEFLCAAYLAIMLIICVAASFIPFFAAACTPLQAFGRLVERALTRTLQIDRRISPKILDVLLLMNKSERVIAAVTPILGLVESSGSNTAYYGLGKAPDSAAAFNLSLLPVEFDYIMQSGFSRDSPGTPGEDRGAGGTQFPVRMGSFTPGIPGDVPGEAAGTDFAPSLPVAEDGYWMVCMRAGAFLPHQIGELAERVGAVGLGHGFNLFADVLGEIAGSIPSLACTPWQKTAVETRLDDAVKAKCKSEKETYEKDHTNAAGEVDPPWSDLMEYGCKKKHKADLGNNAASVDNAKPAKVWDIAKNGSVFMHIWSISHAAGQPMLARDDQGLVVADQGRKDQLVAPSADGGVINMDSVSIAVAEAEYYFDCEGRWSGGFQAPWAGSSYSPGKTCKDNAMWQMGWTARMRRVWWPLDEISLLDIAVEWIVNAAYKYAGYYIGFFADKKGINPLISKNLWDTWLTNQFIKKNLSAGLRAIPGANHLDSAGYWIMQKVNDGKRRTIIH